MSTIASPRPSSSIRSPSSTRTSLDVPTSSSLARSSSKTRRNRDRSALRDYYNLKSPTVGPTSAPAGGDHHGLGIEAVKEEEVVSELDKEGFDAERYVKETLEREGLEGVLRVESGLVSQIKGLDGERKALVYDNYSKLIAATDTIRKMRTNMDPLTPATSTLSPAISHIAETASALSASITEHAMPKSRSSSPLSTDGGDKKIDDKEKQRQTVRWVLDAPRRFRAKVAEGKVDEAKNEWEEIQGLLEKWNGVKGVQEVRKACEDALVLREEAAEEDKKD
ncbi:Vps51/Vps67-domain-containing protein [Macrophomina phaseolina]|uniref:Vacuolar protein sorting-associated protein 51 homolog n=1 Tax=Macrophomina phaseolina TaxID=35725 RepID=A0ABQ8GA26_9PEZI|nr:Vps51/Vps67-domain-containing protein [Macrophomina phaseolina]